MLVFSPDAHKVARVRHRAGLDQVLDPQDESAAEIMRATQASDRVYFSLAISVPIPSSDQEVSAAALLLVTEDSCRRGTHRCR